MQKGKKLHHFIAFSAFPYDMHFIFQPSSSLQKWYFVNKIVLTSCEKSCSSDREKLLKFKAEGREFAKILRSLEQFVQTVKGQNNFW